MKRKILRITIFSLLAGVIIYQIFTLNTSSTVQAVGTLVVDFHVPQPNPFFIVNNAKPSDSLSKPVDVTNGSSHGQKVSVKGLKRSGIGTSPFLETVLQITIFDGTTPVYGQGSTTGVKTLKNFFDSSPIFLNTFSPGSHKTYNFKIIFPGSSGNQFQNKSVTFDVTFSAIEEKKNKDKDRDDKEKHDRDDKDKNKENEGKKDKGNRENPIISVVRFCQQFISRFRR